MTIDVPAARRGARVRPSRSTRPNGQWAVDGREPLNDNERLKATDDGLNVRHRIEEVYAGRLRRDPPEDLYGRFRWWGLYTQRKPGIDGGRTASLEPPELEDRYFMLRVRTDGGGGRGGLRASSPTDRAAAIAGRGCCGRAGRAP